MGFNKMLNRNNKKKKNVGYKCYDLKLKIKEMAQFLN